MISLRSRFIFGSDIDIEYLLFQTTKNYGYWVNSDMLWGLYNACLSVTILPTVLSIVTNIDDHYIFKILFPIIFSFIPLGVYILSKRYSNKIFSYLAGLFFISFPGFYFTTPMHIRQGIAYLFFILIFLLLSKEDDLKSWFSKSILLIYGLGLTVSHYSTSFITLFLLTYIYVIVIIVKKLVKSQKIPKIFKYLTFSDQSLKIPALSFGILSILWLSNFLWYGILTNNLSTLNGFYNKTTSSLMNTLSDDMRGNSASLLAQFNINNHSDPNKDIQDYVSLIVSHNSDMAARALNTKYKIYATSPDLLNNGLNSKLSQVIISIGESIKKLAQLFIIFGLLCFIYLQVRRKKIYTVYVVAASGAILLIVSITLIPFLSILYSLERMYQQCLILLALPAVIGCYNALKIIRNKNTLIFVTIFFCIYFLLYTGTIYTISGGYEPQVQFNNSGMEYEGLYIHSQELQSIKWLSNFNSPNTLVYADSYNNRKIATFDKKLNLVYIELLIPSEITNNMYVYLGYTNVTNNTGSAWLKSSQISYTIQNDFLDENKNLVYNNGGSKIYK
jgi:uncharacterized membrane protein